MVEVLVEYDYTAKAPDELNIKKGDIIREVVKKEKGWWEGTLREKKGVFPENFVRTMEDAAVTFRNKKDASRIRQCRVVFSYKQDHEDELNLNVGDVISVIGEEEEGWWRGILNGKEGVFPSNFVEEIKPKPGSREDLANLGEAKSPVLPPKPAKTLCQVKYYYKAQNEDELTLKEGDIITLINKDGQDPGWWKGELNGRCGVFPDNFVTIIKEGEEKANHGDDKHVKTPDSVKLPAVSAQRKSLEEKPDPEGAAKTTPPVPGKKPSIPVKKSPSGSGSSQGGLFAGLRKKIVDVVDGATGSKGQPTLIKASEIKDEMKDEAREENAFDQIERTPVLSDVRATRAKAPGRRPPSVVFKEIEPGIVNGNADHNSNLDSLTENLLNSSPGIEDEVKPRVREWEKHKAPWLEEMKLNQAKRSSGPEPKLKSTPTEKTPPSDLEEIKQPKTSPFEKTTSPVDMSKSVGPFSTKTTPNSEQDKNVVLRNRTTQPAPRPQSIHSVVTTNLVDTQQQKPSNFVNSSTAKPQSNGSKLSPPLKLQHPEKNTLNPNEPVSYKDYLELLERVQKLEELVAKQNEAHTEAIEDLKRRLQVESDLRSILEAELDKRSHGVMQV